MSAFFSVVEAISISLRKLDRPHKIIIEKSTVPLGTAS
jgi:UDP-glucose 6-dehydrogenase